MKLASLILLIIIAFQIVQMHIYTKQMDAKDKYIRELHKRILELSSVLK